MKEIVEKILKQERVAQERIEKAHKDSDDLVRTARLEAQKLFVRSSEATASMLQRKKQESMQEFTAQKEKVLTKTKDEVATGISSRVKDLPTISEKFFAQIISIEE